MKQIFYGVLLAFWALLAAAPATAQQTFWVQIESQPSLREAEARARAYSGAFENVNGFSVGGRWYAIALGPFTAADAEARLTRLLRENLIPRDSFVADGAKFRQQFWPIGANTLRAGAVAPAAPQATPGADVAPAAALPLLVPDETRREARRSEAALTREERKLLQTALQSEGFYNSAIDGAFGRGTRNAMAAWQEAARYEPTGVLTTKQRADLIAAYNAVLQGLDLRVVRDRQAGIEMQLPMAKVEFASYEPPFAQFDSADDSGVRVLLISQTGDQNTLYGLYDIMQTLEIVPLDGPRERRKSSFELSGANDEISSYTYAALSDGMIKGFTLIWPAGDEKRRARVLEEMKASFTPLADAVLPDIAGDPGEDQRIDLLAGLEIRQPDRTRSGFFLDAAGHVLTAAEAVEGCSRITIDTVHEAETVLLNEVLGIAVLRPKEPLAPPGTARVRQSVPRIQSEVAVGGYPFGGVLGAPTLTFGKLADIRGLNGERDVQRLVMVAQPGDAGGPVFDRTGAVLGVLRPRPDDSTQRLPDEVNFATSVQALGTVLEAAGIPLTPSDAVTPLDPVDLSTLATDVTVLVSCWN